MGDLHFSATAQLPSSSSLVIVQEHAGFNQKKASFFKYYIAQRLAIPFFQEFPNTALNCVSQIKSFASIIFQK